MRATCGFVELDGEIGSKRSNSDEGVRGQVVAITRRWGGGNVRCQVGSAEV